MLIQELKKTDIKCLIIGYDFLETKNVIEKYGIEIFRR